MNSTYRTITAAEAASICADDSAESLPFRDLTDAGKAAVAAWIETSARFPHQQNLGAWIDAARDSAGNCGADEDVVIEMKAHQTASGRTETLSLNGAEIEWLVAE